MIRLVNAALTPTPGFIYDYREIDRETFCEILVEGYEKDNIKSYIGYPQNAGLIEEWTGIRPEVNREQTPVEDEDTLLIMKVNYRPDARTKGEPIAPEDLEFGLTQCLDKRFHEICSIIPF